MSAKRLCFVSSFYPPFNFGGDGVAVQRLARGLARSGCDVTVVHDADAHTVLTPGRPHPQPDLADPFGVRVVTLGTRSPLASTLLTHQFGRPVVNRLRLRRLLDDGGFDAILFNNVSLVGGPAVLSYGGPAARLYVAHEHWLVCPTHVLWRHKRELCDRRECLRCQLHYRRPPQLWRYTGFLERHLAEIDVFIAMSEFSRDKHREFGFQHEMRVVPNFLPQPDTTLSHEAEDAIRPHDRPYFLFVGRLEQLKGLDELIDLMASFETADLLVIGDGTYGETLRRHAAGNPRIHFVGRFPAEAVGRYYRHAIAAIAPSLCFETFGLVLVEAFSRATPVIARRLGAYPEIVDRSNAGLLFSTTAELRAAMEALVASPDLRITMGQRGLAAYHRHWSEAAVIPQYLEAVEEACARRRAR
jgi:glycosyltransferase involved in cell wall biosynthesis